MQKLKVHHFVDKAAYSFVVEGHIPPQHLCMAVHRHYDLRIGCVAHSWGQFVEAEDETMFQSSDNKVFGDDKPFTVLQVWGDFRDEPVEKYLKVRGTGELEELEIP